VIRFAVDENLNGFIVRGLLRRRPDLDIVRIRDTEMRQAGDPAILEWAAAEGRVRAADARRDHDDEACL
jgi:hypothetical protein